jgi:hypothetical protein
MLSEKVDKCKKMGYNGTPDRKIAPKKGALFF